MGIKKNTFSGNKLFIIFFIGLFILTSCGTKDINEKKVVEEKIETITNNIDLKEKNKIDLENEKQVKKIELENNLLKQNYLILEKQNGKIVKTYNNYKNELDKVSKLLNTNNIKTDEIITKYSNYLVKYEELNNLKKSKNTPKLEKKIEAYEKFLINNFEKKGINNVDKNILKSIVNNTNIKNIIKNKEDLKDYTLPDGTISTKEFKESFEDFSKQNNDGNVAVEDFTNILVTEQLKNEGNCELIQNEIDKAYCEQNIKK